MLVQLLIGHLHPLLSPVRLCFFNSQHMRIRHRWQTFATPLDNIKSIAQGNIWNRQIMVIMGNHPLSVSFRQLKKDRLIIIQQKIPCGIQLRHQTISQPGTHDRIMNMRRTSPILRRPEGVIARLNRNKVIMPCLVCIRPTAAYEIRVQRRISGIQLMHIEPAVLACQISIKACDTGLPASSVTFP